MIVIIFWLLAVIYAAMNIPGWDWWFWLLVYVFPPLIVLPLVEALS